MRITHAARLVARLALAALTAFFGFAHAQQDRLPAEWLELPFAQRLDIAVVREVTRAAPEHLLPTIARFGVDLLLVRTAAPSEPLNPILANLPPAPDELIRQAEFQITYEGRVIPQGAACCATPRDTILIRDTASTYTLLHEFVQSRLQPTDASSRDDEDVELRFAVDFWRLKVYQRRLNADPYRLLDPLWRRDILAAQTAVADRLFRRIQIGQSQEAIVEKVLCCHIDETSPYYDAGRRAEGLRYGEAMIDNAIDVFNVLHDSVAFVREQVRSLREAVRAGHLEPVSNQRLTDEDVQTVEASTRTTERSLSRVREELNRLKLFYTR